MTDVTTDAADGELIFDAVEVTDALWALSSIVAQVADAAHDDGVEGIGHLFQLLEQAGAIDDPEPGTASAWLANAQMMGARAALLLTVLADPDTSGVDGQVRADARELLTGVPAELTVPIDDPAFIDSDVLSVFDDADAADRSSLLAERLILPLNVLTMFSLRDDARAMILHAGREPDEHAGSTPR